MTIKSPLRYPGGKTRAIKTLEQHLPPDINTMLSPFLGGASFELHMSAKGVVVHGFDAYTPLVNFWQHALGYRHLEMVDIINDIKQTGLDRDRFRAMQHEIANPDTRHTPTELAAYFYVVNRSSFSGSTLSGGYSARASVERFTQRQIDYLETFHAPNLTVHAEPFEYSLLNAHRYDFIFLDPPYEIEKPDLYGTRGSTHKTFDHDTLAELLNEIETRWLVTYNDYPRVRERYKHQNIYPASWAYGMNKSKQSSEIIITNY